MGRVYLLWAEGTTRFKVGFTRHGVGRRAWIIERYSPMPLRVIADVPGTTADEHAMHRRLRSFRTHSEWFDLPESQVWRVLSWFGVA